MGDTVGPTKATWQGSVRVSRHRLEHIRKQALEGGWRLSELARMLICLGATFYFLRLRNAEALERFRLLATMNKAYGALDRAIGRGGGRRHEPRHIDRTTLLPTHLPRGLYRIVSAYSGATGVSKNALVSRFLEAGFIMYMLGEETLFKALVSTRNERTSI